MTGPRIPVTEGVSGTFTALERHPVAANRSPEQHLQTLPNGTVRKVYAYTESDRPLFDSVWAKHYANVVAESALFAIDGGA